MSGARKLMLSGIALIALLALVAVASRAHHPGGGNGAGPKNPPTLIFDYLASTMIILLPIGAVICVWAYFDRRRRILKSGRGSSWRGTLVLALAVTPFLAVAFFVAHHGFSFNGSDRGSASNTKGQPAKVAPRPYYKTQFQWLPALLLGSIALAICVSAGAVYVRRWRAGDAWDDEAALAIALDEVLADTLDDLRAEGDARRAVIRTYARMEQTFAAYGVSREEAETPQEYVGRVLARLQVSAFAVQRLARLYERAKFSEHQIDAGMKDEAIETLVGLRGELEYKPEEQAA